MSNRGVIALFVASLLAAPAAFAQREFGAGNMIKRRVDRLALELGLTPGQQTEATGFFTAAATANQMPEMKLREDRRKLNADIKASASQSTLAADANAVGADEAAIVGNNAFAESQFIAILTADQVMKYEKLERGGFGGGFGPGPGPGRPGLRYP